MPATVHIPARIVVDPLALRERQCCIDDALGRALRRAVAKSWREVLHPRGGYRGIRLVSPEFSWTGQALDGVDPETRAQVEERIRQVILEQVEAQDLGRLLRRERTLPLTQAAFEPFDPTRYNSALGLYEIPAYQGGGKKTPVNTRAKKAPKPPVEYVEKDDWRVYPGILLDNTKKYRQLLGEMLDTWSVPPRSARGMLWREPNRWVLSVHSDDEWYGWLSWDHFTERQIVSEGDKLQFKQVRVKPYVATATARVIPASEAREELRRNIRTQIINHAQKKGPIGFEFMEQVEQKTDEQMKVFFPIADLGAKVVEVDANGTVAWVYHPNGPVWEGVATLAPLTHAVKVKKEVPSEEQEPGEAGFGEEGSGEGEGAGAGAGKGRQAKAPGGKPGEGKEGKSPGALGGYGPPGGIPTGEQLAKAFGFVYTGEEGAPTAKGSAFPSSAGGKQIRECKTGWNGEPSLRDLGQDGELLRELIEEIAFKLRIPACEYAAQFAAIACEVQAGRAVSVSEYGMAETQSAFVQPVEPKKGSIGIFDFIPAVSPAVQFMRHLAGVSPRITVLVDRIYAIYKKPEHLPKVLGDRYHSWHAWFVNWGGPMNGLRRKAAGMIFAMTCRVVLMQLLRTSQRGILDRLKNIDAYSRLFEELIKFQIADLDELVRLRDDLKRATFDITKPLQELGEYIQGEWEKSKRQLVAALEFRNPFEGMLSGPAGAIVTAADGTKGIRDSKGSVWSLDQLDRMLSMQRDVVNQIDPLIPQITMDKEVLARFARNPGNTRYELEKLLREMLSANEEKIAENRSDPKFGFRASAIRSNWKHRTIPGCRYALSGVHSIAHEQIGEFFAGDWSYGEGVDSLLRAQEAWEEFKMIAEFTGVIFLAIVCAPLAFVVGGALSVYHYHEAKEKEELFKSLLDPELIITRAEVEAELFAAELGVLLSFIPDAGPILRGGGRLAKGVVQGEAKAVARALGRRLVRRMTLDMVRALKGNLAESFVKALATAQGMNMFLGKLLIEPAIEQIQRDLATYEQIAAMARRT